MSLNIQTNVTMPQNQMAFKANPMEKMAKTARILHELGADIPQLKNVKETLWQKIKRNILFSPEQQERIKFLTKADIPAEKKQILLVNEAVVSPNIFANIISNIKRIFLK